MTKSQALHACDLKYQSQVSERGHLQQANHPTKGESFD